MGKKYKSSKGFRELLYQLILMFLFDVYCAFKLGI
jgi:hypothetical protein